MSDSNLILSFHKGDDLDYTPSFKPGILSRTQLQAAVAAKIITASRKIQDTQFQPASLDLRLGAKAWRVKSSFLTGKKETVETKIKSLAMHEIDLTNKGAVLEKGCVYIAELMESLDLPKDITAFANPKSSTGRLDVFTRVIADYSDIFEFAPPKYRGKLYLEISPRSFTILVRQGSRLSQLRLRAGDNTSKMDETKRTQLITQLTPIYGKHAASKATDGGVPLSINLTGDLSNDKLVGWQARENVGLIDVDGVGRYRAAGFWERITADDLIDGGLVLNPNRFYILASHEYVAIPSDYAAEMTAYDTRIGEFRAHYAGFFDPGFGMPELGADKTRAVLEVRSHDVPFFIEKGQTACRLVYDYLSAPPDVTYGDTGSNYQGQGLRLSKHFQTPTAKTAEAKP
ncbi:MAG: 2'-deoxycytidine 5'-triphosphate deaminase [Proteobacteria bacterium]|nr:2'-deoxycytidine 5'-triphosphate deaminase [Pseudomonadota bacterium]